MVRDGKWYFTGNGTGRKMILYWKGYHIWVGYGTGRNFWDWSNGMGRDLGRDGFRSAYLTDMGRNMGENTYRTPYVPKVLNLGLDEGRNNVPVPGTRSGRM